MRHWFHTNKKPREGHTQFQKQANFSGEAMEARADLHAAIDRWIDEAVGISEREHLNVWRIGALSFRVRMGRAVDPESAGSIDDGIELRYPALAESSDSRQCATYCDGCKRPVTEDGEELP